MQNEKYKIQLLCLWDDSETIFVTFYVSADCIRQPILARAQGKMFVESKRTSLNHYGLGGETKTRSFSDTCISVRDENFLKKRKSKESSWLLREFGLDIEPELKLENF